MGNTLSKLRKRPNRRTTVTFPYDPSDSDRHDELSEKLAEAKRLVTGLESMPFEGPDDVLRMEKAKEARDAAQEALDEYLRSIPLIRFHLVSCGAKRAEQIQHEHPPTKDQLEKFKKEQAQAGKRGNTLAFDEDTFPAALIAACTASIEVDGEDEPAAQPSAEDIEGILDGDGWSDGDGWTLFNKCRVLTQLDTSIAREQIDRLGKD